jgi:CubicO group peptidase (beta-lactamase class C family)
VSVRIDVNAPKSDPAAGEYGWSGAASTYFWVAPKAELVVIVMQQVEPFGIGLQLALRPVIHATIEK